MSGEKVAVITAGGSGMGAATARKLAQDGYRVAILSSSGKGEALAKELGGVGVTGSNLIAADVQRLFDLTMDRWGRIDALVNSAGHGPHASILEISDEDWHKGMEVYFLSAIGSIHLAVPIMVAQGGGAIVNISTAWVTQPSAMFPTSAAFRASLATFTKILADDYAAKGGVISPFLTGCIRRTYAA
ncbi:MAG: SDR family NAD(P)-dependent oxidoreductase, partial [Roseovarius sp.]